MHLVLINHYAGSPAHGMEFRPHQIARHWVAEGHDVTILAGSFSHLRNRNPEVTGRVAEEFIDGIRYRWLRTPEYHGNGLGRIRSIHAFIRAIDRERRTFLADRRVDAVIASSTYPFDIDPARRIARDHHATLVWEVHDLWPLSPIELAGYSPKHPFIRVTQRAEDRCCREADLVVSILPRAIDHLRTRGLDPSRYVVIPNGASLVDESQAPAVNEPLNLVRRLRAEGRFVVGYAGGHNAYHGLGNLIEAAAALKDELISFVLVGEGEQKSRLEARVDRLGLDSFHFMPRMSRAGAFAAMQATDAIFVGLRAHPIYRFGIGMNKIYDGMLAGRPLVAAYTAGNDPVNEAGCGLTVPAGEPGALADALHRMMALDADERDRLGAAGRRFAIEHHEYGVLARRFVEAIESTAATRPRVSARPAPAATRTVPSTGDGDRRHLVLINHYAGSPAHGMEFRPHQIARHWVAEGHDVTILAGSFSHLRNRNPEVTGRVAEEFIDGIRYRWLRTPEYQGNGLGRIRSIHAFIRAIDRERRTFLADRRVDAVIASSTYPFDIDPARRIARDHDATLVWEVHDLWPLSPIELAGYSPKHPFIRVTQRAEDRCCREADLVVSILPRAIDHLRTRGLDPSRYVAVPNGVDLDENARPSADCVPDDAKAVIDELRRDHRFVIGYAGSHTTSYGLDALIEAVRLAKDVRPAVVFVGDGPEKSQLQSMAADLPNVRFLDRMPRQSAISTLQACDAVFVGLRAEPLFRFGIGMNKIFDAMLVERPVLAAYSAGNDPIGEAGCGITVPAGDIVALADAIRRVHAMLPAARDELGTAGGAFVRANHDYRVLASRFLESILTAEARA